MAQCASCKASTKVETEDISSSNNIAQLFISIMPYLGVVSVGLLIFLIIKWMNKLKNGTKN